MHRGHASRGTLMVTVRWAVTVTQNRKRRTEGHIRVMTATRGQGPTSGAVPEMHQWMEASAEKIATHTCTQEEVDQEVKDQWGAWLQKTVATVDDTKVEGKIAMQDEQRETCRWGHIWVDTRRGPS